MKSFVCAIGTLLITTIPAGAADTSGFTQQKLYQVCSSDDSGYQAICLAYFRGLLYGITFGQRLQNGGHPICLPQALNPETARLIFKKAIEENPKSLDHDGNGMGDIVATLALAAAYPCKPTNSN